MLSSHLTEKQSAVQKHSQLCGLAGSSKAQHSVKVNFDLVIGATYNFVVQFTKHLWK